VGKRAVVAILAMVGSIAGGVRADADESAGPGLPVMVGSRVRISAPALLRGDRIQGVIAAVDRESATVTTDSGVPVVVPRETVASFEVSVGRKRNTLKGTAIGAVAGAAIGVLTPVDPGRCRADSSYYCSRQEAVGTSILGAAVCGAVIGAFVKSDRWVHVPLDRWSVNVAPLRGGGRASLSLSF
jgi:hypothetical protein